MARWSNKWSLFFNAGKCSLLRFHSGRAPPILYKYSINAEEIPSHHHHRDLGVIISSDLSCSEHVKHLVAVSTIQLRRLCI